MSLSLSIFFGHFMSPHHSEKMAQRSQVSRIVSGNRPTKQGTRSPIELLWTAKTSNGISWDVGVFQHI